EKVEDDNPQTIWAKAHAAHPGRAAIVAFKVTKPDNLAWPEILASLKGQSYVRALVHGRVHRLDDLLADAKPLAKTKELFVAQDRVTLAPEQKTRFLEAV